MYRRSTQEESQRITGQAAEWLQAMRLNPDADERAAFTTWVTSSQQHLQEFLVVSMLDRELTNVDRERRFDIDEILKKAVQSPGVIPLRESSMSSSVKQRSKRSDPWQWAAGIAGLALLATAWWMMFGASGVQTYATATSEQREIELADGSIVGLNARSRLEVRFSDDLRQLHLIEGEALFKVARDRERPFRVHSGGSVIQAVGTQFNVNRRQSGTTVAVIEGKVRITAERQLADQSPANLAAGETAKIAPDGRVIKRAASEAAQMASWRQRRLHFRGDTLAEITEEFNRYNEQQIRVEDEVARMRHFNGVFDADDPDSFVEFLRRNGALEVASERGEIVIRSR
jgi:transmembrane sensor